MPAPVTKTFYFNTASFPGTTFGGILEVAPPNTATTWGWIVGQNAPPQYCQMNRGVEIARTSTQWLASPTASAPNQNAAAGAGNAWVVGPYNGEFLAGTWQITQSVKATTNAAGQDGRFIYRFYTASSGSGLNPTLISSTFFSSSTVTNLTTTPVNLTSSITLPQFTLHTGFLCLVTYWYITGAATNNAADVDYVFGISSCSMKPTQFVGKQLSHVGSYGDSET